MSAATETNELLQLFIKRGALHDGHFLLSSGLHSDRYLQSALVLQDPVVAADLGARLAARFQTTIDVVISPAIGGLIIGHEVARAAHCRAIFSEKDELEKPVLRRGFRIEPGEKVLVVEDVITTGLSTNEVVTLVQKSAGELAGVGSVVNRSTRPNENLAKWGKPIHSLLILDVKSWAAGDCLLCQQGMPITKPGSRKL